MSWSGLTARRTRNRFNKMPSLAEIAARFGGEVRGDSSVRIDGVGSLSSAGARQLAFYESDSHREELRACRAAALLVSREHEDAAATPRWVVSRAPRLHFARLARWLHEERRLPGTVSPAAVVAADAVLGANVRVEAAAVVEAGAVLGDDVFVGPGAIVGARAQIGDGTTIHARATVCAGVVVGRFCVIHGGAVVGADGFGFVRDDCGAHIKMPQLGSVRLGDRAEVGANSAIDRGALDDTVVGDGVKIDNLVQIGHNARIGDNTVICGCAGIAGSVQIGANCTIGGGAGIAGHLTIGDGATIAAARGSHALGCGGRGGVFGAAGDAGASVAAFCRRAAAADERRGFMSGERHERRRRRASDYAGAAASSIRF